MTVIPFCPLSLSVQPSPPPPHPPPQQCCAANSVIVGNKQATLNGGAKFFQQFFRDKKSGVRWCTNSTMEGQFVN